MNIYKLIEMGFVVFPVGRESKTPLVKWRKYAATTADEAAALFARHQDANVGIRLGQCEAGCVIVVDTDGPQALVEIGERELPATLTVATGKDASAPGSYRHYYYRWDMARGIAPPSSIKWPDKNGHCDLKGEGGYVVAPPSIHANGNAYRFIDVNAPIAPAPEWLYHFMQAREDAARLAAEEKPWQNEAIEAAASDVEDFAITYLRERAQPSIEKSGGSIAMFSTALYLVRGLCLSPEHAASLMDAHYQEKCTPPWEPKDFLRACKSSSQNSSKPMGFALEYVPRSYDDGPTISDEDVSHILAKAAMKRAEIVAANEPIKEEREEPEAPQPEKIAQDVFSQRVEGFRTQIRHQQRVVELLAATSPNMRDILGWLSKGAPQPLLQCAAAVALAAVFCGRRVHTRTGLLCSLYSLGVAESGEGKGAAKDAVSTLIKSTWGNAFMSATWPSVQSTFDVIKKQTTEGRTGVMFHDNELGKLLSGIFDPRAPESKRGVGRLLLDVNPCSHTRMIAAAKSLAAGGGEEVVLAPAVCLYGTTTPLALDRLVQSDAREDGLLGRMIFFRGIDGTPERLKHMATDIPAPIRKLATDAREVYKAWEATMPKPPASTVNGDTLALYAPIEARYTMKAIEMLDVQDVLWHRERVIENDAAKKTMINRAQEQVEKLAMALAVMANMQEPIVDVACVEAAHEIVSRSVQAITPMLEESDGRATDNGRCEHEIMKALHNSGKMKHGDLTRMIRRHKPQVRKEALDSLRESGLINVTLDKTGGAPLKVYEARK